MLRHLSIFLFLFIAVFSASGAVYVLDDSAIEEKFQNSEEISLQEAAVQWAGGNFLNEEDLFSASEAEITGLQQGDQAFAVLVCFFFGVFGLHRVYLDGSGVLMFYYTCTAGGCLAIWLVDTLILMVDGTERFRGNNRFIAW